MSKSRYDQVYDALDMIMNDVRTTVCTVKELEEKGDASDDIGKQVHMSLQEQITALQITVKEKKENIDLLESKNRLLEVQLSDKKWVVDEIKLKNKREFDHYSSELDRLRKANDEITVQNQDAMWRVKQFQDKLLVETGLVGFLQDQLKTQSSIVERLQKQLNGTASDQETIKNFALRNEELEVKVERLQEKLELSNEARNFLADEIKRLQDLIAIDVDASETQTKKINELTKKLEGAMADLASSEKFWRKRIALENGLMHTELQSKINDLEKALDLVYKDKDLLEVKMMKFRDAVSKL